MKLISGIIQKLMSVIIIILIAALVAEIVFVWRHGYFFRLEDIVSFIRGR